MLEQERLFFAEKNKSIYFAKHSIRIHIKIFINRNIRNYKSKDFRTVRCRCSYIKLKKSITTDELNDRLILNTACIIYFI